MFSLPIKSPLFAKMIRKLTNCACKDSTFHIIIKSGKKQNDITGKNMGKLEEALYEYYRSGYYPFHMPGHKQRWDHPLFTGAAAGFAYDITEIDGFDDLHHAQGLLKEAQQRAADLYHAGQSFFLVNGSTCGILAAVSAAVKKRGTLLMARNSHKAAYHAVFLRELTAEYLYPPTAEFGICGSISPKQVEAGLNEHPEAEAVFLTSPTYDGIVSDIRSIAEIVHQKKKLLIVDEAHGAHFGFHEYFPESSVTCGADLVITSLHKTLPAYTQSALLLVKDTAGIAERIGNFLDIYETSSPSYLFMAQMDHCIALLAEKKEQLFTGFAENLNAFYRKAENLKQIDVFLQTPLFSEGEKAEKNKRKDSNKKDCGKKDCDNIDENVIYKKDPSKILISAGKAGMNGKQLYDRLRKDYHLQPEMYAGNYVTALTSMMDTPEAFHRLAAALEQIETDYEIKHKTECQTEDKTEYHTEEICCKREYKAEKRLNISRNLYGYRQAVMTIAEAGEYPVKEVPLAKLAGRISGAYLMLYPPGIPIVTPGEHIPKPLVKELAGLLQLGYEIEGLENKEGETYGKIILPDGKKFFR